MSVANDFRERPNREVPVAQGNMNTIQYSGSHVELPRLFLVLLELPTRFHTTILC